MSEYHDTKTGEIIEVRPAVMPPEIAAAIFQVKSGIKQLGFDERNDHGKYGYASIDKFYAALRPLETEAGLQIILDEVSLDVRSGDTGKGWAFINYEVWFLHRTGVMWGPLRRHIALPVTGAQTFGAAESYIHKAFRRGFYMVPTGEKDADDLAQSESAPITRGATRAAKPLHSPVAGPTGPAGPMGTTLSTGNGQVPPGIAEFLKRESYEIDLDDAGGPSPWQRYYIRISSHMNLDQLAKLSEDNARHWESYRKAVRPEVFKDMLDRLEKIVVSKRDQEAPLMEEGDVGTALSV